MEYKHTDSINLCCFPTAVPHKRRPPPFEDAGLSFDVISVKKSISNTSQITYEIKSTPMDCAFGFPLLRVGFLPVTGFLSDIIRQNLSFLNTVIGLVCNWVSSLTEGIGTVETVLLQTQTMCDS